MKCNAGLKWVTIFEVKDKLKHQSWKYHNNSIHPSFSPSHTVNFEDFCTLLWCFHCCLQIWICMLQLAGWKFLLCSVNQAKKFMFTGYNFLPYMVLHFTKMYLGKSPVVAPLIFYKLQIDHVQLWYVILRSKVLEYIFGLFIIFTNNS